MENKISANRNRSVLLRILRWTVLIIVILATGIYVSFKVSPWPSVLLIRCGFSEGGSSANDKLAKYLPGGVGSKLDIQYDTSCEDAMLDLYYPEQITRNLTLIVWVHGGGFVAGDKSDLSNYCKIIASKGYIVAAVNYSIAPEAEYPEPVRQLNSAIAYLLKNASEYKIDTSGIFVAGDSGGAHITAQLANVFTSGEYASMLGITPLSGSKLMKGVILHCGTYDAGLVNFDGKYGDFMRTVMWSYMGTKDFLNDPKLVHFSVANFITPAFPRTFISVGNGDPLRMHSYELTSRLVSKGVAVDSLFFAENHSPALQHEYQFDLDTEAGKLALERTIKFLSGQR